MPNTSPLFIGPKSFMKLKENYNGVYGIRNSLHVIHSRVTKVTKLMTFRRRKNPINNRNEHSLYYIFHNTPPLMIIILCLIKTSLGKTQWDKNLVKEKEYTISFKVASLKPFLGKPSGIKP